MIILDDLKFIESAMRMLADSLADNDLKRAETCILYIQNYLNDVHHPLAFFSAASLFDGNEN